MVERFLFFVYVYVERWIIAFLNIVLFILFGNCFESVNVGTYCCWHNILQWPGCFIFDLFVISNWTVLNVTVGVDTESPSQWIDIEATCLKSSGLTNLHNLGKSKLIVTDVGLTNLMESIAQEMQWVLRLRLIFALITITVHALILCHEYCFQKSQIDQSN